MGLAQQGKNNMKMILASGSPRRQSLLNSFGFEITVQKPEFDESKVLQTEPCKLVTELAEGKMDSIDSKGELCLSADTVVSLDGKILGKPLDEADAFKMLRSLSGNTHSVYTGVCITYKSRKVVFYEKSDVTFHKLSDKQINAYIETKSPMDKAGAYGVQDDMAIAFVKCVDGELSNVIGLPMGRVINEIERIIK